MRKLKWLVLAVVVAGCSRGEEVRLCGPEKPSNKYVLAYQISDGENKDHNVYPDPGTRVLKMRTEEWGTEKIEVCEVLEGDYKGAIIRLPQGHFCPLQ